MLRFELKVDLKVVRNLIHAATNTQVIQTEMGWAVGEGAHGILDSCFVKKKKT